MVKIRSQGPFTYIREGNTEIKAFWKPGEFGDELEIEVLSKGSSEDFEEAMRAARSMFLGED